jgi:tetratricopeptide (TPR) repeat protein
MLKMLESERPQQVRQIHERAFAFYQNEKGTAAAIEWIYHALQLSKEPAEIRTMWVPEAAESLLSSVEELPASSQLLVYEITQRDPPPELRPLASLEQWERVVETKARQALQYGEYDSAERLLKERDERTPGSALYAIAAVCRMRDGDNGTAEELLNRGIESAEGVNRIDRLAELYRLRGELRERQSNYPDANASMALAQQLAMRMGTPVLALQICAERARVAEAAEPGAPPVEGLDEIVKACGDADFASVRLQLRGLFRICGPRSAPLLLKGLRVFKLDHLPYMPDTPFWAEEAYGMAVQGRLNEFLQKLLEREPENASTREAISWILEDALNPNVAARSA